MLIVRTLDPPAAVRRRLRRPKPKRAAAGGGRPLPLTELTVVDSQAIAGDPASWLEDIREDPAALDELVGRALSIVVRAVAAQRLASADPALADPALERALAVRVGYGSGDALVEGRWADAVELPAEQPRAARSAALRPQERLAALLGGRDQPLLCEEILLRARADLDAGRDRQAALQLRVGLEALLADAPRLAAAAQDGDLAALEERRPATGESANLALGGELPPERTAAVAETLAICERVLRRRAAGA